MKLKFELAGDRIKPLHELLKNAKKVWGNEAKVNFYFDEDGKVLVYPAGDVDSLENKAFVRVHITNEGDTDKFFRLYEIKS